MQADNIRAMNLIGDKSAVPHLIAALGQFRTDGQAYLDALAGTGPVPLFSHQNVQAAIEGFGDLKAPQAWSAIKAIVDCKAKTLRLGRAAASAMRAVPNLIDADNRKTIEQTIAEVAADSSFGLTAQYQGILAAGKLKLASVLPAIHDVMTRQRPCWSILRACAWATYQITGQAPQLTEPVVNQGHWIIRKSDR
jgi:hypothetical protein